MRAVLRKLAESDLVLGIAVLLVVVGFLYLRHGAEYFSGSSGGAYWDNMNYCASHRDGQMNIYGQLVTCRQILAHQTYCKSHLDESINVAGANIACDVFLGQEDEPEKSFPPFVIALVLIVLIMYGFVCRVVAREIMKTAPMRNVFFVCWAIGIVVFGITAHLTTPEDPWAGGVIVGALAAALSLALAGR